MTSNRLEAGFQGSIFALELDDVLLGLFTGCTGLGFEFGVITHKVVGVGGRQQELKVPGVLTYNEVVFKRGVTSNMDLYDWYREFNEGTPSWKTASIAILDRDLEELARFNLDECWPSKVSLSDLKVDSDEIMIEECTIQHHMIDWIS